MLKVFHAPQSRSTRILWLLEELGADYEIAYTTIPRMDGSGGPDPANPHPDKKVPALVHDGVVITESIAIMQYLTDLFPDAGVGPKIGDRSRGPYLSWLAYYAGVAEPVVTIEMAKLGDQPALARNFRGRAEFDARLRGALDTHDYIVGDRFSAVDILFASVGQVMRSALPAGDRIDDFIKRCTSRPAVAKALAKDKEPG